MNSDSKNLLSQILRDAAGVSSEERGKFLDRACQGDGELRAQVEAQLQAEEAAAERLQCSAEPTVDGVHAESGPHTRIGRYKLLQLIGEGGFGSVYMAEQEEPVRRKVAIKVIKPGMDTKQVIARFEAERQALALMDRPAYIWWKEGIKP